MSKVEAPFSLNKAKNYKYDEYFVAVTGYWSDIENINLAELSEKNIKADTSIKADMDNFLRGRANSINYVDLMEIKKGLAENEVAIVKWNDVTPNLKTLSFEGKYLWNKKNAENYSLKVEKETSDASIANAAFKKEHLTKIIAGGDVMLSRHVSTKIMSLGVNSPWQNVSSFLTDADITFVNLEVPISNLFPPPSEGMSFIAPLKYLQGVTDSGVDIVSVANNHTANFGQKVFEDNLKNLTASNIPTCGGGANEKEARTPKIIERNDIKFAFLCYNSVVGGLNADSDSGSAFLEIEPWYRDNEESIKKLENDVRIAKQQADVVIVSPHWGVEYKLNPNNSQKKVAERAINAGADLIIGTHPHVVQGLGYSSGKYTTYSLGNLIFDQEWSTETKEGVILESYFYQKINVASNLTPIIIEDYHRPRILKSQEGKSILERIKSASIGF